MSRKSDLPKGCQWPVNISALVAEIRTHRPELEVNTSTISQQAYRQKKREQMRKEGKISILDCDYSPDGQVFPPSDTPRVSLSVRAVEKEAWTKSRVRSEQIQRILREHLEYVSKNQAWDAPWRLAISWLGASSTLECKTQINRLKRGEEALTRHVAREL